MRLALGLALVIVAAAGCRRHDVHVLFGPNEETLTIGFRCVSEATGEPLFTRVAQTRHFALLIDLMVIHRGSPGCRGEDLAQACGSNPGNCEILLPHPYCIDVALSDIAVDPDDPQATLRSLAAYLREVKPVITPDAPDEITVVRAVATTEFCEDLKDRALDPLEAVGCAYSCPLRLDDVEDSISLSLDALSERCEAEMRACAAFLQQ